MADDSSGANVAQDKDARIRELERELMRAQEELREVRKSQRLKQIEKVSCPKCGFAMKEIEKYGIVLDLCQGCQGVYFDGGEVDQLITWVKHTEQTKTGGQSAGGLLARLLGRA